MTSPILWLLYYPRFQMVSPLLCGKYFSVPSFARPFLCAYVFAIVNFSFLFCRLLLLMEVLQCKRDEDSVCVSGGLCGGGDKWPVQGGFHGLKYRNASSMKDRECLCYTELYIPDQSNRSLKCFTSQLLCATNILSWFVPPYMGCLW